MVIKNLKWKRFCPGALIRYINDAKKVQDTHPIYWNVSNPSIHGVYQDIKKNDQYLNLRKNSNRLLHDIISFSPKDNPHLSEAKVRILTLEYLKSKATKNIAYGRIHQDQDHWHVHLMIAPNELYRSKVTHYDRKEYHRIREDLELFQKKQFPELSQSIVFLKDKKKEIQKSEIQKSNAQFQVEKRSFSPKEKLSQVVQSCYKQAECFHDFVDKLLQTGYETYTYRQKSNGILYEGKKYRFSGLGISKDMLQMLDKQENRAIQKRLKELESLQNHSQTQSLELWR